MLCQENLLSQSTSLFNFEINRVKTQHQPREEIFELTAQFGILAAPSLSGAQPRRRSFPASRLYKRQQPGSTYWVPIHDSWCMEPNMGSRTAQQSFWTCLAPISPPDRHRRCPFIAQVRVTSNNVKIEHGYCLLLPVITYHWPPQKRQHQTLSDTVCCCVFA